MHLDLLPRRLPIRNILPKLHCHLHRSSVSPEAATRLPCFAPSPKYGSYGLRAETRRGRGNSDCKFTTWPLKLGPAFCMEVLRGQYVSAIGSLFGKRVLRNIYLSVWDSVVTHSMLIIRDAQDNFSTAEDNVVLYRLLGSWGWPSRFPFVSSSNKCLLLVQVLIVIRLRNHCSSTRSKQDPMALTRSRRVAFQRAQYH